MLPVVVDISFVQNQLKNVQQIQASNRAFAAILGDGSVVQLKNVEQVQATSRLEEKEEEEDGEEDWLEEDEMKKNRKRKRKTKNYCSHL